EQTASNAAHEPRHPVAMPGDRGRDRTHADEPRKVESVDVRQPGCGAGPLFEEFEVRPEIGKLAQFGMGLIGRRREAIGPEGDLIGDARQFGALLEAIAHAGRTDDEIEGEPLVIGLHLDFGSVPRDLAPGAMAVDSETRFGAGAIEGVARRRLIFEIEMTPDIPARAVVELAVMRQEGGPLQPAMRVDDRQPRTPEAEVDRRRTGLQRRAPGIKNGAAPPETPHA